MVQSYQPAQETPTTRQPNAAEAAAAELASAATPATRKAAAERLAAALAGVWVDVARDCSGWLRARQITHEDVASSAGKNASLLVDRIIAGDTPQCTPCHYVWLATKRDMVAAAERVRAHPAVSLDAILDGGSR
ncbi:MAG: hypothetical protein ACRDX8_07130 [Acidimicrobiales bacterium]